MSALTGFISVPLHANAAQFQSVSESLGPTPLQSSRAERWPKPTAGRGKLRRALRCVEQPRGEEQRRVGKIKEEGNGAEEEGNKDEVNNAETAVSLISPSGKHKLAA